jgi:hypothetical protein
MKYVKQTLIELTIPLLVAWFLLTIFVDIFTVPAVFRNSSSIVDAGKIGMLVFGRFNKFELLFSVLVFAGLFLDFKKDHKKRYIIIGGILIVWALLYNFYMTPMITNTTFEIHQTNVTDPLYAELQTKHAYYHNLYRKLDSTKILVLLVFIVMNVTRRVKKNLSFS